MTGGREKQNEEEASDREEEEFTQRAQRKSTRARSERKKVCGF
jgi:hypothetical protein